MSRQTTSPEEVTQDVSALPSTTAVKELIFPNAQ